MLKSKIKTHTQGKVYNQPHFFILNKGLNSGKPFNHYVCNSFVFLADDENEKEYFYFLLLGLWELRFFRKHLKGSVIEYVRLGDVIDVLDSQNTDFIYGDVTDPELLEELALAKAKLIVSTVTDHDTNIFLARWLERVNPHAVFVCPADDANQAATLYEEGAAYVMMPHYIGSEKIGSFIKKNGFNKTEFRKFREKHLEYLETNYA